MIRPGQFLEILDLNRPNLSLVLRFTDDIDRGAEIIRLGHIHGQYREKFLMDRSEKAVNVALLGKPTSNRFPRINTIFSLQNAHSRSTLVWIVLGKSY